MNLPDFAERLQGLGIMKKCFVDLSREEAEAFVMAAWDTMEPTGARRMPYFRERVSGQRELFIPFDAPAEFRDCLSKDGWMATYRILEMLGASEVEKVRYLGRDWQERMHKRTLFKSNPCCPVCGGAIKEKAA